MRSLACQIFAMMLVAQPVTGIGANENGRGDLREMTLHDFLGNPAREADFTHAVVSIGRFALGSDSARGRPWTRATHLGRQGVFSIIIGCTHVTQEPRMHAFKYAPPLVGDVCCHTLRVSKGVILLHENG